MAVEKIVAEHEARGRAGEEIRADEKGLREAVRLRLLGVGNLEAELRAVAEEPAELRQIVRRRDDEDFPDVGQHQDRQRIIDHRLVIDRHELLAHGAGHRIEPGAGAAGEDDAFAFHG